jgi:DNA-binding transcriptional regulator YiaG
MTDEFSVWLKQAREDAKLSQRQVGELVGVSTAAVCRWEAGQRSPAHAVKVLLEMMLPARRMKR